ncbi:hypothetical protein L9F63_005406, partial [Diploptera punctata]
LKKEEYTVGKDSGCSYVIKDTQLDRHDYSTIAKKQFKISKKKDGVYLEDIAGTYINNKKVGPGLKVPLNHNDRIAIARMFLKVFIYMEKAHTDLIQLPDDIGNNFHVSYKLGEGGFGEVSLVFEKETGKRFAMKTVKKNPKMMKYVSTEAHILSTIKHPCIIMTKKVVDTFSTLFIVMEMMDGGDLMKRVISKSLTEANIKLIFFQLVQAIQCLHKHNVVHRDIKPENVLLASMSNETLVKVTDFGVSKILTKDTVMDTVVGTRMYIAPEIKDNFTREYTKQVDVWSLGVLLYYCLSTTLPFNGNSGPESYIVTFPRYAWSKISVNATTLIKAMLQVNPFTRINIDKILENSWLKDETMRRQAHNLMWPDKPYFMSQHNKPRFPIPAAKPQLVQANIKNQNGNRQALPNSSEKPPVSPLEKKIPVKKFPLVRNEAKPLQKLEDKPKPYISPYAKQQNVVPSQPRYQSKPEQNRSPIEKRPFSYSKEELKENITHSSSSCHPSFKQRTLVKARLRTLFFAKL